MGGTEPAAEFERQSIGRADGTAFTLRVRPGRDAAAPMLLIQPAMGVPGGYYGPLALALAGAGCNVGISELRGHEDEGGRLPGWRYDYGYAEAVHEDWPLAVAAMRARFPQAPLYLLGHSLGGQVSCLYAATKPEGLAGIILIACASVDWRLWSPGFLIFSQTTTVISYLMGHFPGRRFRFAGREARTLIRDWARQARTGRFRFGRPRVDYEPLLAEVRLPVLAITLDGDWLAPPRAMDGLLMKMPQARLTRRHVDPKAAGFEKIDHFRWARQPAVVMPEILSWLHEQEAI